MANYEKAFWTGIERADAARREMAILTEVMNELADDIAAIWVKFGFKKDAPYKALGVGKRPISRFFKFFRAVEYEGAQFTAEIGLDYHDGFIAVLGPLNIDRSNPYDKISIADPDYRRKVLDAVNMMLVERLEKAVETTRLEANKWTLKNRQYEQALRACEVEIARHESEEVQDPDLRRRT
jgi:hypothetical protein